MTEPDRERKEAKKEKKTQKGQEGLAFASKHRTKEKEDTTKC